MTRINTREPGVEVPEEIGIDGLGTDWTTLMEAPDFSVPDVSSRWPNRDPLDNQRRIQPGVATLDNALLIRSTDSATCWVDFRVLRENGDTISLQRLTLNSGQGLGHPIAGLYVLKKDPTAANGGRLQARAQRADVIDIYGNYSVSAASEHEPAAT